MGQMVDVQVVDINNDPVKSKLVKIRIHGIDRGGKMKAYTDEDGHASFEITHDEDRDFPRTTDISIWVDGDYIDTYDLEDGAFTVTLDWEDENAEERDEEDDNDTDEERY
jgi:hypothetical protein